LKNVREINSSLVALPVLQHLVESLGARFMAIKQAPESAKETIVAGTSRGYFPLESMKWLKPFGRREQEEDQLDSKPRIAKMEEVQPLRSADTRTIDLASKLSYADQEKAPLEVSHKVTSGTSDQMKENPVGDLAADDALPLFLQWSGIGEFFGINVSPSILDLPAFLYAATELHLIPISIPEAAGHAGGLGRKVAYLSGTMKTGKLSTVSKKQFYDSDLQPHIDLVDTPALTMSDNFTGTEDGERDRMIPSPSPISSLLEELRHPTDLLHGISSLPILSRLYAQAMLHEVKEPVTSPPKWVNRLKRFPRYSFSGTGSELKGAEDRSSVVSPSKSRNDLDYPVSQPFINVLPTIMNIPTLNFGVSFELDFQGMVPAEHQGLYSESPSAGGFPHIVKYLSELGYPELASYITIRLNLTAWPLSTIRKLASESLTFGALSRLLPQPELALARIRTMDHIPTLDRAISAFRSGRLIPSTKERNLQFFHTALSGQPGQLVSPPSLSQSLVGLLDYGAAVSLFAPSGYRQGPRYEIASALTDVKRQRKEQQIVESRIIEVPFIDTMPISATLEEQEVAASRSSFTSSDMQVGKQMVSGIDEFDLGRLRTTRKVVHTIMKEQLRKYGVEI
jgi:hypothetical protein